MFSCLPLLSATSIASLRWRWWSSPGRVDGCNVWYSQRSHKITLLQCIKWSSLTGGESKSEIKFRRHKINPATGKSSFLLVFFCLMLLSTTKKEIKSNQARFTFPSQDLVYRRSQLKLSEHGACTWFHQAPARLTLELSLTAFSQFFWRLPYWEGENKKKWENVAEGGVTPPKRSAWPLFHSFFWHLS